MPETGRALTISPQSAEREISSGRAPPSIAVPPEEVSGTEGGTTAALRTRDSAPAITGAETGSPTPWRDRARGATAVTMSATEEGRKECKRNKVMTNPEYS